MRKRGSVCEFTEERNDEIKRMFKRRLQTWDKGSIDGMFAEIAAMPASRFYVSEVRVERVLRHHLKRGEWNVKNGLRRRMFAEIELRVMEMISARTGQKVEECRGMKIAPRLFRDAIFEVVNSPAPSFYLTPRTCRTLLYEVMNRRCKVLKFTGFSKLNLRA